jgi:hypothetical protein
MRTSDAISQRIVKLLGVDISVTEQEREAIDQEIDDVVRSIAGCCSVEMAQESLDQLDSLQFLLASLLCKYNVPLSDKQRRVFRECDRLDDLGDRIVVFNAIKNGTFP